MQRKNKYKFTITARCIFMIVIHLPCKFNSFQSNVNFICYLHFYELILKFLKNPTNQIYHMENWLFTRNIEKFDKKIFCSQKQEMIKNEKSHKALCKLEVIHNLYLFVKWKKKFCIKFEKKKSNNSCFLSQFFHYQLINANYL